MASLGPRIWLPNTENFFCELVDLIRNAEVNRTCSDSADFYFHRLEEYERTLSILTARISESYPAEQSLINNLRILCNHLNSLRSEFLVIVESYERSLERLSLEESYDRAICTAERNGLVGRPRIHITEDQLTTLHNDAGFRWADVARTLGVSERTLRRRRHQFGLAVGRGIDFTDISDNDLDRHVHEILRTTPSSGQRLVEGGLRNRGLRIQRRRIQESMRRVDPVISTLRSARSIIRRVYNVPSPNSLW